MGCPQRSTKFRWHYLNSAAASGFNRSPPTRSLSRDESLAAGVHGTCIGGRLHKPGIEDFCQGANRVTRARDRHVDGTDSLAAWGAAAIVTQAFDDYTPRLPHAASRPKNNRTCLTPTGVAQMRCSERSVAALAASYTRARPPTTFTLGRRRTALFVAPSCCAKSAGCDGMRRKEEDRSIHRCVESVAAIDRGGGGHEGQDEKSQFSTAQLQAEKAILLLSRNSVYAAFGNLHCTCTIRHIRSWIQHWSEEYATISRKSWRLLCFR